MTIKSEPPAGFSARFRDRVSSCCKHSAVLAAERIAPERAEATATAVQQIASAGFAPDETWHQLKDYLHGEYISFAREL